MRLLVTGGGTGGHVYPALAVVEELVGNPRWATQRSDVAWVGTEGSIEERILAQAEITFYPISAGAVRGRGPLQAALGLGQLVRGYRQAHRILSRFRPQAVLATGGYVSAPLLLAARCAGCPALIYLPDMGPGRAIQVLSRLVARVAVSFASVVEHFPPGKAVVTGYPVRSSFHRLGKAEARRALGLTEGTPVLLATGGSQGSHSINEAVRTALPDLMRCCQLVHVTGSDDYAALLEAAERLPEDVRPRYRPFAFMYDRMPEAIVAADLVIARAGAATLGEFPAAGVPSVLVPYPYAGRHQQANAAYLVDRGAAVLIKDSDVSGRLRSTVSELLADPGRLATMSVAARALAAPRAAELISEELVRLAV